MEKHLNCWEHMLCGREPGGTRTELGICPVATEQRLDKVHGGKNAGRACWAVAGSFARGNVEGTFAKEYRNCAMCDFYKRVRDEEGIYFWPPFLLHEMLGQKAN